MKKIIILLSIALVCVANAAGQKRPVELNLEQAIEIALDENLTIRIADMEIERQKYVRKETLGGLYPSLAVTGQYTRAIIKSEMAEGLSFDPDNQIAGAASLNLPLFAPSIYKTLRVNQEQMRAAVESARSSRITTVNSVKNGYYGVLLAQQSLEVLRSSEQNISETVETTRANFENGLASEYDLLSAEVQLSNIRPQIIEMENNLKVMKQSFAILLNLPPDFNFTLTGSLDNYAGLVNTQYINIDDDLSSNTDLRAMDIQIDMTQRQLELQRTLRMPSLSAFGNFNVAGRDPVNLGDMMGGAGGAASDSFMWTNPLSVGVQISIPIFAGNSRVNKERQIKNQIEQLKTQRYLTEQQVDIQLRTAINSTITARETMLANENATRQAQRAYEISKTRYDAGMGTMLEISNAELLLTQAKLNYTNSIYNYLVAQSDYERIRGEEK